MSEQVEISLFCFRQFIDWRKPVGIKISLFCFWQLIGWRKHVLIYCFRSAVWLVNFVWLTLVTSDRKKKLFTILHYSRYKPSLTPSRWHGKNNVQFCFLTKSISFHDGKSLAPADCDSRIAWKGNKKFVFKTLSAHWYQRSAKAFPFLSFIKKNWYSIISFYLLSISSLESEWYSVY